jgi:clan AA aspartic protease
MIHGIVDWKFEATLQLAIGDKNPLKMINAIVDTGFDGFLMLPKTIISDLGLSPYSNEKLKLADGTICISDVYKSSLLWDGNYKMIDIHAHVGETTPLVGMSLLRGYRIQIDVVKRGEVTLQLLSSL